MAKTAVADIIIPTEFEKYAIERTAELSRVRAVRHHRDARRSSMSWRRAAGAKVKMPFWKDLTATRQLLSDSASLTVNKITTDKDIARIHNDAQVWSVNHLAKVISGDDPMQAIVDLVARLLGADGRGAGGVLPQGHVRRGDAWRATCWRFIRRRWRGSRRATRLNGATFVDATREAGRSRRTG